MKRPEEISIKRPENGLSIGQLRMSHDFLPSLFVLHHLPQKISDLQYLFKMDKSEGKLANFHRFVDSVQDYRIFPGAKKFLCVGKKRNVGDILLDSTSPLLKKFVAKGKLPSVEQAKAAIEESAVARKVRLKPNEVESLAHLLRFHHVMVNPGFEAVREDAFSKFYNVSKKQDANR
jgi:hypothetical protein